MLTQGTVSNCFVNPLGGIPQEHIPCRRIAPEPDSQLPGAIRLPQWIHRCNKVLDAVYEDVGIMTR